MSRRPERTGRPARQARNRRLNLEPLEARELLSITVTTAADNGNNASPITGSLRAAIIGANNTSGLTTILFSIPGSGVQTIALESPLPAIANPVMIDGLPMGSATTLAPTIVIDGTSAGSAANGLIINNTTGGNTILGLSIVGFSGEGIYLAGTAGGTQVEDDYIGIEPDGKTAKANGNGIAIASPNNTIGGTSGTASNLISGNTNAGVAMVGSAATGNLLTGNLIGTDSTGKVAIGNQYGVLVASPNNTIGGTASGLGNLISGNVGPMADTGTGILFEGQAQGNLVEGNKIGTNLAGTSAVIPGGFTTPLTYSNVYGIYFGTPPKGSTSDNTTQETIGGSVAGAGNLISGNYVGITGSVALTSSVIAGNTVGLNLAGTSPIPNGDGIVLGASLTTIGGTTSLARNVISGNSTLTGDVGTGLQISGDSDVIEANYVGVGSNGLAATGTGNVVGMILGNSTTSPTSTLTNSTIGGTTVGLGNLVSGNSSDAIQLLNINGGGGDAFYGNVIGLDIQGNGDGNGGNGISLSIPAPASTPSTPLAVNESIGATTSGSGNILADNGGAGVLVNDLSPTGVTGLDIRGNTIFSNARLGIDTQGTGVPVASPLFINGASVTSGQLTLTGVYTAAPGTTASIDLFANASDPSGYGQGPVYLGSTTVTTNGSGFATFSSTFVAPTTTPASYSATFTPSSGNTTEFTANFPTATGASEADLIVVPSTTTSTTTVDNTVTLTESIGNAGPNAATSVVLYDTLSTSLIISSVVSSQGTVTVSPSNNLITVNIGAMASGAIVQVTITGTASQVGALVDQPGISSNTFDPNYANNVASQTITVNAGSTGPSADVAVLQSANASTAVVGSPLTYTISVGNIGPNAPANVSLVDTLPAGVTIDSITSSQGSTAAINGNLIVENLGTMASGSVATVTIVVTPTAAGSISNLATVNSTLTDPVPANNRSTLTTTVQAGPPSIHFYLAQVAYPTAGAVGQFQAFTLYVENFGPNVATNVFLIDNIPANVTYYSGKPSQGTAPLIVNGQIKENFGTLAAGAVASFQLIVIPRAVGLLTNVAGVYTPDVPTAAPAFANGTVPIVAGPSVLAINGMGSNAKLAVTFNEAMNVSTVTNVANYVLQALGPKGTSTPVTIKIASILYNPVSLTVTLLPAQAIDPTQVYRLTLIGNTTSGIADTLGRRLASTLYGPAGNNFAVTFFAGTLPQI